jgi:hypothetical protein
MNNETKGLIAVNPAVGHLYRAVKDLSSRERTALNNELRQDFNQQETAVSPESIASQTRILQQINLMTPYELALVLEVIASKFRSAGTDAEKDDF